MYEMSIDLLIFNSARNANEFTVSVNIEPQTKVTFNMTYEELLTRRNGHYHHCIHIDPGAIVPELKVKVHITEVLPIIDVQVPELPILFIINVSSSNGDGSWSALGAAYAYGTYGAHGAYQSYQPPLRLTPGRPSYAATSLPQLAFMAPSTTRPVTTTNAPSPVEWLVQSYPHNLTHVDVPFANTTQSLFWLEVVGFDDSNADHSTCVEMSNGTESTSVTCRSIWNCPTTAFYRGFSNAKFCAIDDGLKKYEFFF